MGMADTPPLAGDLEQGYWAFRMGRVPAPCSSTPGFGLCPLDSILPWEK